MSEYTLVTLNNVESTNGFALNNINSYQDKTVIFSPLQSSGRGRFNRKWISDDSNNVYLSFVLKSDNFINFPFQNLTQYLSVVICNILEKEFYLSPAIKWPNDILIDGAKISGILAESFMSENKLKAIVLGIGLNVNLSPDTLNSIDQKAVSLYSLTGKNFDVLSIAKKIADAFFENYENFLSSGFSFIKNDYLKRCSFLGKNITVKNFDFCEEVFAKEINDEGLLVVINNSNKECTMITGDVLC